MIEQGIRDALAGDNTISSLTGNRIAPMIADQSAVQPRIQFQVTGDDGIGTFSGPTTHSTATVEIDAIADTYKQCASLAAEIKRVLNWTAISTSSVKIDFSKLTDETDIEQALIQGTERPVFLRTLTFEMLYRAA